MKTSIVNLLGAAVCSATAGAVSIAVIMGVALLSTGMPPPEKWIYGLGNLAVFSIYAGLFAFGFFLLGVLLIGVPVEILMRRLGWRSRLHGAIAGLMLSPATAWSLLGWPIDQTVLVLVVPVAVSGAFAGWMFRHSLRSVRPPPAPPSAEPTP